MALNEKKKIPKTSNTRTEKSKKRKRRGVDKVRGNEPMFANEEQSLFVSRQSVWITVKRLKFLFYLFFLSQTSQRRRSIYSQKLCFFFAPTVCSGRFFSSLLTQLRLNANLSRNNVQRR